MSLSAYDFLYSGKSPTEDDFYKKNEGLPVEFELEALIDAKDLGYIEESQPKKVESFKKYLSNGGIIKIRRVFNALREKGKMKIENPKDTTLNPVSGDWEESAFGTIGLSQIFQYLLPTPILIKAMPTEEEVELVINEVLSSKAKQRLNAEDFHELSDARKTIRVLQDKMYNPDSIKKYKEEINSHFKKLFPDIFIEFDDVDKVKWTEDKFGKRFGVHFQRNKEDGTRDDSIPTSYQTIGHGAIRSAIFSLLLMRDVAEERDRVENRKEYLVLFEEPELFLHPKLMRELRELIYSVSGVTYPYQLLCASHSPQMIDISKPDSSLVRMVRDTNRTILYQIDKEDLKNASGAKDTATLKEQMYEVLRFNPHICESFYADEIILVEGPTEEVLIRAILQKEEGKYDKEVFVVNCGSVTNIPFYQKVYSKFLIKYHIICDTDNATQCGKDEYGIPCFSDGVQKSIYEQFKQDRGSEKKCAGILHIHHPTFEPVHGEDSIPEMLRFNENGEDYKASNGKPLNANLYWRRVLEPNYEHPDIEKVPIIKAVRDMMKFNWA